MEGSIVRCPACASEVRPGSRFCMNCGYSVAPSHETPDASGASAFGGRPVRVASIPGEVTPPQFSPAGPLATAAYSSQLTGLQNFLQGRDPLVAFVLELVGYIGVLGLGHLYAGRIARGVAFMVGWWFYWGIVAILAITVVLSPVACLMTILWPVAPLISGFIVRRDLLHVSSFQTAVRP